MRLSGGNAYKPGMMGKGGVLGAVTPSMEVKGHWAVLKKKGLSDAEK